MLCGAAILTKSCCILKTVKSSFSTHHDTKHTEIGASTFKFCGSYKTFMTKILLKSHFHQFERLNLNSNIQIQKLRVSQMESPWSN